jgi:hypothetical protein
MAISSHKNAKGEIELDFSEDIKNMNKKEIKNEEIEAKKPHGNSLEARPKIENESQQKIELKAESSDKGEAIQTLMLQMQNQYKIYHWQTTSFSQHKSFDGIVESLIGNIDEFIETYMGKYGRVISSNTFNLSLANLASSDIISVTDNYIDFLIGLTNQLDANKDTDLLNIRDEMLGSLNQLKYLFSLV